MRNRIENGEYNRRTSLGISLVIFNSFMVQYYVDIINSYVLYIVVLCGASLLLFSSNRKILAIKVEYILLWYFAAIMMAINLCRSDFDINTFADLATFITCVFMCSFINDKPNIFFKCFNIIDKFAVYYAFTIWIQILLPSIYKIYLDLMPANIQVQILRQQSSMAYTGFSSNLGFTAGHIVAGILLSATILKKKDVGNTLKLMFLPFTLFLTGKRSTFAFLVVALIAIYLVSTIGIKKVTRLMIVAIIAVLISFVLMVFQNQFSNIAVFSRIIETINGVMTGEDVSSSRSMIYLYAITLFQQSPIFGIGWGCFRKMTLGNITWVNTVEVHNIYLQLLCETGIVGFIIMIIPMVVSLIHSYKALRYELKNRSVTDYFNMLQFAFAYQVFFLLYGLVENALYDYNFLIMYFLSCAIVIAYERYLRKGRIETI